MIKELKPCPMCCGKASFGTTTYSPREEPSAWFSDGTPVTTAHSVNCQRCGVNNRGIVGGYQTQEEAAAAWNTRARDPRMTKHNSTGRIRKAWRASVKGCDGVDILYAPNAGKARYKMLLMTRDFDDEIKISDITVLRAQDHDVTLPERHPLAHQMTDKQIHCVLHAFGYDEYHPEKSGYRDHYYTGRKNPDLCAVEKLGIMKASSGWEADMAYFRLTQLGKDVALSLVPEYGV